MIVKNKRANKAVIDRDYIGMAIDAMTVSQKSKYIPRIPIDLIRFLVSKKALTKYVDNFIYQNGFYITIPLPNDIYQRIDFLLMYSENPSYFLYHSFSWEESEEGYTYWGDLFLELTNNKNKLIRQSIHHE